MSTKQGYVYILINPSLKGLLKVGQTKKDPEERAKEISQGTGVPTPYIVVYKEQFKDCELAEKMIHTMLEEEGYRINKNREFFEAEISDIIRKIMIVREHLSYNNNDDIEFVEDKDLFSSFEMDNSIKSYPWDDIEYIADASYYGYDDELEDYEKAYEYYIKAYNLGSSSACEKLGKMNEKGKGVKENKSLALNFYKEGVSRGNLNCWMYIGKLYLTTNVSNSKKAFKKFFEKELEDKTIDCFEIFNCILYPSQISLLRNEITKNDFLEIIEMTKPFSEDLLNIIDEMYNECIEDDESNYLMKLLEELEEIIIQKNSIDKKDELVDESTLVEKLHVSSDRYYSITPYTESKQEEPFQLICRKLTKLDLEEIEKQVNYSTKISEVYFMIIQKVTIKWKNMYDKAGNEIKLINKSLTENNFNNCPTRLFDEIANSILKLSEISITLKTNKLKTIFSDRIRLIQIDASPIVDKYKLFVENNKSIEINLEQREFEIIFYDKEMNKLGSTYDENGININLIRGIYYVEVYNQGKNINLSTNNFI